MQVAPAENTAGPSLSRRPETADPDGDIVHPAPLAPGELGAGATIRVRLLDRLSTTDSQPGDSFHTRVASDVVQDGQVLIPAGSEIDGKVISVSTGHAGGHGSMRLRPETVTLPDGSHFRLYAQLSGAPGSRDRILNEGLVTPGSRFKKDGIEYGAVVGPATQICKLLYPGAFQLRVVSPTIDPAASEIGFGFAVNVTGPAVAMACTVSVAIVWPLAGSTRENGNPSLTQFPV